MTFFSVRNHSPQTATPTFGLKCTAPKRRQIMDPALMMRFKTKAGRAPGQTLRSPADSLFQGTGKLEPDGLIRLVLTVPGSQHHTTEATVTTSGRFTRLLVHSQPVDEAGTLIGERETVDVLAAKLGTLPATPLQSETLQRIAEEPETGVSTSIHLLERFMLVLMGEDKI